MAEAVADLFHRVLHHVAEDVAGLAHADRACDRLLLDRRVPLLLHDVDDVRGREVETKGQGQSVSC